MTAAGARGGRAAGESNEAGESGGGVSDRADQRGRVQIVVDESACVAPDVAKRHGITVVALGLDEVDGEGFGVLAVCLDDGHVVAVDGEVVVRLARYVDEAESVSVAHGTSVGNPTVQIRGSPAAHTSSLAQQ